MLPKEKLMQLMTDLESETVERTRAFDKAEKMGQAISAFANDLPGRGVPGYLLLGVEDNGEISHRRITDEQMTALGGLKTEGNLLPQPSLCIERFSFDDGDVVAIEVFPTAAPPVRFKGQAWVRVGARKALASDDDLHIFEERRQYAVKRFEILPCSEATLNDLDLELFKNDYLPKAIKAEAIEDDSRPIEQQMSALRFYDYTAKVPTNLGMILFGKHPEMFIPSAYIQYVRFAGSDNGSDILAEHSYKGPLIRMIQELDAFVKVGIAQPHPVKVSALQEKMFYHYPDWAVRELLLNAVIHRDYQLGNAPIKFYDYNGNRLEISNPGGLYGLAKPDNFPLVNDYRNPLLAGAMKVEGFVNKYNRGIAKVKQEMEENGNPPPMFDVNKHTEFRVTLCVSKRMPLNAPNDELNGEIMGNNSSGDELNMQNGKLNGKLSDRNSSEDKLNLQNGKLNGELNGHDFSDDELKLPNDELNDEIKGRKLSKGLFKGMESASNEEKILHLVGTYPGIQRKEMAQRLNVSLRTLDRTLKEMMKDHRNAQVEHRGSRKNGGWFRRT